MNRETQRLDVWLWRARFFKSRSLATKLCAAGRVRVNGDVVSKAHHAVGAGDVLTFPKDPHIRVIRILGLGHRRGPAPEAQALYEDLDPPKPRARGQNGVETAPGARERGAGRPTKADRRAIEKFRGDAR